MTPTVLSDEYGSVKVATIATYGDTVHTLVQKDATFKGVFLPNFKPHPQMSDPLAVAL